jgi:hypothetical protein
VREHSSLVWSNLHAAAEDDGEEERSEDLRHEEKYSGGTSASYWIGSDPS